MEAQKQPCSTVALADQPAHISPLQAAQNSSTPSQSPVLLQQEQALSQTIYLKALTIPLYHPIQSGCYQPNNQLAAGGSGINLENSNMPLILNPVLHSERTDQSQSAPKKPPGHTLTINIISSLPVLPPSSCPNAPAGSPGKSKNAGKYICKHCGRDCLKPSVLEKHIRSHTGERPFPCTTCGIAFKTQSNLYKHRRTQTHVNNTRLPSESDHGTVLEENERAAEGPKAHDNACESPGAGVRKTMSETNTTMDTKKLPPSISLPTLSASSLTVECQRVKADSPYNAVGSQGAPEREAMQDPQNLSSPVVSPGSRHHRRKIQEQRSPTANKHIQLQRQQATYSDKQWDCKPSDYKLKKCESTDSGYLSRSDSTEQQLLSSSPLHSLYEHSTELENETAFSSLRGAAGSGAKLDSAEKATALMLEKKKLEEHISKLISHNKAVVDDTQLDNVRPRKTVLSKQGSIDLPMPYTYKDSFHFDIRSLDANRKKNLSLCSAKSTFTPMEKSKPLFFHSVPTQFSTTIDCVPVTRSNSLPFIDSAKIVHEKVSRSKPPSLSKQSLNTSVSSLLHSNKLAISSVDFPNSHPRALVRQAAVDDLPLSNAGDNYSPSEDVQGAKKPGAGGDAVSAKCKKSSQRKLKMFSQEKWQMYGDETFKKIYQKMKSSQAAKKLKQKGNKATDVTGFIREPKGAASGDGAIDGRSSTSRNLSSPVAISTPRINPTQSETRPTGNHTLQSVSSEESAGSFTELMETSHSIEAGKQRVISNTSQEFNTSETHRPGNYTGGNNILPTSSTGHELRQAASQLSPKILDADHLQLHSNELEEPHPVRDTSALEAVCETNSNRDVENHSGRESAQHAQTPLRVQSCNSGESSQELHELPSERKKMKVDAVKRRENVALKSSSSPNSRSHVIGETVSLREHYSIPDATSPTSIKHSVKEKELSARVNESVYRAEGMQCEKKVKPHREPTDNVNHLTHSAGVSTTSFSEFLAPELKGNNCISFALHKLTNTRIKTCLVTTGPLQSGHDAGISSKIQHLQSSPVTPLLQKNAFSPKYVLKLPQDRSAADLTFTLRPEQKTAPCTSSPVTLTKPSCAVDSRSLSPDPGNLVLSPLAFELRHEARREGHRWNVQANWKAPIFCLPTDPERTNSPTKADDSFDNQSSRQKEIMEDTWRERESKDNLSDQRQAEEKKISTTTCSAQTSVTKVCFASMYTGSFFISTDIKGENRVLRHLHSGRNSLIMTSAGRGPAPREDNELTIKGWDEDSSSCCVRKDASPKLQDIEHSTCSVDNFNYYCHSFGTFYCHTLSHHSKELSTRPQNSLTCYSGNTRVSNTKGSFPSLNAEPRLTWCCLTRSLPLPAEQKEKADSAYSSLHICKNISGNEGTLSKCDFSFFKMKNVSKTMTYGLTNRNLKSLVSSFSQGQQIHKQSSSTAGSDDALENISEEKKKELLCRRREKLTTNKSKRSHKRKKMKINQKWYKGSQRHEYAQLKPSRLSKEHRLPNRSLDPVKMHHLARTYASLDQSEKHPSPASHFQDDYLHVPEDPFSPRSEQPVSKRNNHKKEDRNNSGIFSPIGDSSNIRQSDKVDRKEASRLIKEHSRVNLSLQKTSAALGPPVTRHTCSSTPNTAMQQANNDLNICCLVTQPLMLQQSAPAQSQSNAISDPVGSSFWSFPFDFIGTGKCHQHDIVGSEVTSPVFLWPQADQKNILNGESQAQRFAPLDLLVQSSEKGKHLIEENAYASPKEKFTPSSKTTCSALLGSNKPCETITRTSLPSIVPTQGTNSSHSSPNRCPDKSQAYLQPDDHHDIETSALKEPSFPFSTTEATATSAAPSKAYKKRSLEMMRKQTRVEYDDTSSDDEDRLVIEI
ncbi:zinc finger protein 831 [Alligator mississippiensis]|uniref:zinc finger protein 831 n=1 Tax=Alligator mississippiensis TaxID=8496 RepID=UPI0003D0D658|nr:zinc finger protein 831 [Alligator mississippiensis]